MVDLLRAEGDTQEADEVYQLLTNPPIRIRIKS